MQAGGGVQDLRDGVEGDRARGDVAVHAARDAGDNVRLAEDLDFVFRLRFTDGGPENKRDGLAAVHESTSDLLNPTSHAALDGHGFGPDPFCCDDRRQNILGSSQRPPHPVGDHVHGLGEAHVPQRAVFLFRLELLHG